MDEERSIIVRGARTHNLKGIDCEIPRGRMTVVTGVSGSGKSSLAFDTVHAEGQRRYVETLSTYARQFMQELGRPPVQEIRNLPPSLALRQGNSVNNARSKVGTLTELADHLQILFARAGQTACRECGGSVRRATPRSTIDWLHETLPGERILVLGAIRVDEEDEDGASKLLRELAVDGYRRLWHAERLVEIDSPEASDCLESRRLEVVIDRLRVDAADPRLSEAIESAFAFGEGVARIIFWDRRDAAEGKERTFDPRFRCVECGASHTEPIPALFKSQSRLGACGTCEGYGRTVGLDPGKVIPDPRLSLRDGAIVPFEMPARRRRKRELLDFCASSGIAVDVAFHDLSDAEQRVVIDGSGSYAGVRGFFRKLEKDRYKPHVRILIARFRGYTKCDVCGGTGLNAHARAVKLAGLHIGEVLAMRVEEGLDWIDGLVLGEALETALKPLLTEIRNRFSYLCEAGTPYLTLDRPARTLSGGEMHRVLLATTLGRVLTDTCYVLDEPTAGLHAHDTERLIGLIEGLRDIGNTVLVVEHDVDVMMRADHVIELGPAGGERGGRILHEGTAKSLVDSDTATGHMLRRRMREATNFVSRDGDPMLEVRDAVRHNLRGVACRFPHHALSVVTGVSGSGKSTLIHQVLYRTLMMRRGYRSDDDLGPVVVEGDTFDEIVLVDQDAVSRSVRSCPLTFSGAYTPVRELLAGTADAAAQGLRAGAFSFNTAGGRCERCEGLGHVTVEMHFMPDIEIPCDVCEGRRFRDQVLAVRWKGYSIDDIFRMTVDDALTAFDGHAAITRRLKPLAMVGLGYLALGQPTTELSGGEAQRLKLASYVGQSSGRAGKEKLFLFDEPTVGLHMSDVEQLLKALRHLLDAGHTVVVVEHNLDFIACCDWVVDMGPGAGPQGGRVLYEGPTAGLCGIEGSLTGLHLRKVLKSTV